MRTHPAFRSVLLGSTLVILAGCETGNLARTFGLTRDAPDEYSVTTRAPLSMPPDYNLRPPRPGAARPQEQGERQQAAEALAPQLALAAPSTGGASAAQQALIDRTGPAAPADIRTKVDRDAHNASDDDGFVDRLLYWRKPGTQNVTVDASKESARLRENAALGQSPDSGPTPMIQPAKKGWFSGMFGWL
jgi:hypothetical protein